MSGSTKILNMKSIHGKLAFVIAHEYAHFAARHGNESATKFIFFMAGDVLAENKAGKIQGKGKAVKGFLLRGKLSWRRICRSLAAVQTENGE